MGEIMMMVKCPQENSHKIGHDTRIHEANLFSVDHFIDLDVQFTFT